MIDVNSRTTKKSRFLHVRVGGEGVGFVRGLSKCHREELCFACAGGGLDSTACYMQLLGFGRELWDVDWLANTERGARRYARLPLGELEKFPGDGVPFSVEDVEFEQLTTPDEEAPIGEER